MEPALTHDWSYTLLLLWEYHVFCCEFNCIVISGVWSEGTTSSGNRERNVG